jgi:hypothetical protein
VRAGCEAAFPWQKIRHLVQRNRFHR